MFLLLMVDQFHTIATKILLINHMKRMSDNSKLKYTERFRATPHDCNRAGFLTIPSLLRSLQHCSLAHARSLKTSVWDLSAEEISWVLIRKELKIIRPLKMDEEYTVITYPSGFEKFFAFRDYLVFDTNKKIVAGASSVWTMIDTIERKLVKIPDNIIKIGVPEGLKFLPHPDKKLGASLQDPTVHNYKVGPYDVDWNNHVNNIVLCKEMLIAIKNSGVEDHEIAKILFHFKNEVHLSDLLSIKLDQREKNLVTTIFNIDDRLVSGARIYVRDSKEEEG